MTSDEDIDGERTPLLIAQEPSSEHIQSPLLLQDQSNEHDSDSDRDSNDEQNGIERGLLWRLYTSHFLSTWNMRSYEFTVILLFATAYPTSLLPTSIRGVLTNLSTLLLSPAIGSWVDRNASRFHTMKITIVLQRVSIIVGCVLWSLLLSSPAPSKDLVVAILIGLGFIERLCAVGNNLVMERDWVPTIMLEGREGRLGEVNAVMRRIDLVSKILAPVVVSAVRIRGGAVVLVVVTALTNLLTVGVELSTARSAWGRCRALKVDREPKPSGEDVRGLETRPGFISSIRLYFNHTASLASLSSALQSFSVLSLSGPMTTYLLTRHYSLSLITTARTLTSIIEIASTILFPLLATLLTTHPITYLPDPMAVLGLGGITLQFILLIPCLSALAALPSPSPDPDPARSSPGLTAIIFIFLGLGRLGHWIHNLSVQQIAQTQVPARYRVEFSGVEMTFVSAAEIGRWGCAAIWSSPKDFWGVGLAGLGSVAVVWGLFGAWVLRERRGGR